MADIFISYAREDLRRLQPLIRCLSEDDWSVFWDHHPSPQTKPFNEIIRQQIDEAKAVVVAWSAASQENHWVQEEALRSLQQGKLIQISIDPVVPALVFRRHQVVDFTDWTGDPNDQRYQQLRTRLSDLLSSAAERTGTAFTAEHVGSQSADQDDTAWNLQQRSVEEASSRPPPDEGERLTIRVPARTEPGPATAPPSAAAAVRPTPPQAAPSPPRRLEDLLAPAPGAVNAADEAREPAGAGHPAAPSIATLTELRGPIRVAPLPASRPAPTSPPQSSCPLGSSCTSSRTRSKPVACRPASAAAVRSPTTQLRRPRGRRIRCRPVAEPAKRKPQAH